jgi:hypothetical protein
LKRFHWKLAAAVVAPTIVLGASLPLVATPAVAADNGPQQQTKNALRYLGGGFADSGIASMIDATYVDHSESTDEQIGQGLANAMTKEIGQKFNRAFGYDLAHLPQTGNVVNDVNAILAEVDPGLARTVNTDLTKTNWQVNAMRSAINQNVDAKGNKVGPDFYDANANRAVIWGEATKVLAATGVSPVIDYFNKQDSIGEAFVAGYLTDFANRVERGGASLWAIDIRARIGGSAGSMGAGWYGAYELDEQLSGLMGAPAATLDRSIKRGYATNAKAGGAAYPEAKPGDLTYGIYNGYDNQSFSYISGLFGGKGDLADLVLLESRLADLGVTVDLVGLKSTGAHGAEGWDNEKVYNAIYSAVVSSINAAAAKAGITLGLKPTTPSTNAAALVAGIGSGVSAQLASFTRDAMQTVYQANGNSADKVAQTLVDQINAAAVKAGLFDQAQWAKDGSKTDATTRAKYNGFPILVTDKVGYAVQTVYTAALGGFIAKAQLAGVWFTNIANPADALWGNPSPVLEHFKTAHAATLYTSYAKDSNVPNGYDTVINWDGANGLGNAALDATTSALRNWTDNVLKVAMDIRANAGQDFDTLIYNVIYSLKASGTWPAANPGSSANQPPAAAAKTVKAVKAGVTTVNLVKGTSAKVALGVYGTNGTGTSVKGTWKASKKAVASVVAGKASGTKSFAYGKATNVTIKAGAKTGKSVITIKLGAKTQKIVVNVVDKAKTAKTLTWAKSASAVAKGASKAFQVNLKGTTVKGKAVTFSSSKSSVASVAADGMVTGVKAGKAKITAKVGAKSLSKVVTVR